MKFFLFSKIPFEIPDPDLLEDKKIEDVKKIGARIKKEVLSNQFEELIRLVNLGSLTPGLCSI